MKKSFKGFIALLLAVMLIVPAFSTMAEAFPAANAKTEAGETVSRALKDRTGTLESTKTAALDFSGIRNGKTFKAAETEAVSETQPTDIVTIMVELEAAPAADVVSDLKAAGAYRQQLLEEQSKMVKKINSALGTSIVPTHNYSVLFNGFAFDGEYRLVSEIDAMDGVHAFVSPVFESPELFNTTTQVGAVDAWELGYTGAGYTVAIVDTGCKVNHPAFSVDPEEVQFTRDDIAAIIASGQLNGSGSTMNVNNVYVSAKIPFQWNYEYNHADASHPGTSDHGTHVAGIAAVTAARSSVSLPMLRSQSCRSSGLPAAHPGQTSSPLLKTARSSALQLRISPSVPPAALRSPTILPIWKSSIAASTRASTSLWQRATTMTPPSTTLGAATKALLPATPTPVTV